MGTTDPHSAIPEDDVDRLLESLGSLSADLAADVAASADVLTGDSPAARENQAIRHARSSVVRKKADMLAVRVEEVRRAVEGTRERARRERPGTVPSPRRTEDATDALRATLAESARQLNRTRTVSRSPVEMLEAIVAGARRAIPNVTGASVTLMDPAGVLSTHAPSDDVVAAIERSQTELGEGPCVDALTDTGRGMMHVPDLERTPPWPRFAAQAVDAGFHEVLSFQLVAAGSAGALNLYAKGPDSFDPQDVLVGALFADQAAVALSGARRIGELNRALETRDLIGRAKGILMERFTLDDQEAFAMLVESSQHTNMKLVTVAEWLVAQAGAAPSERTEPPA